MYDMIRDNPSKALAQADPTQAGEWTGALEATVEDDFEHRRSRTRWILRSPDGPVEVYGLQAGPSDCGQSVRVRGVRVKDRIAALSVKADGARFAAGPCSATTGTQTIA